MRRLAKFTRDEDRAQAEEAGDTLGDSLSHPEYRALVVREAQRTSRNPDTRAMFLAKRKVDRAIGRSGTKIYIPGATPGRRTV